MLNKKEIEKIVHQSIEGTDKFLVDITVSSTNVIDVFVDADNGVSIEECVKINRLIESSFDRDKEDYELRVSSPGLGKPFKMIRQYKKYVNREIEVVDQDGRKVKGILKTVSDSGFRLERKKGKKGKEVFDEDYLFDDIKEAKPHIGF